MAAIATGNAERKLYQPIPMQSPVVREVVHRLVHSKAEPLRFFFWLGVAAFVAASVRLAVANQSDGGWDSASNLIVARSVAAGHGFTTLQAQELVAWHPLPGRETVRAPGLAYLAAAAFAVTRNWPAAVVGLNVLTVLLAALCLRAAVRRVGPHWLAEISGILVLASPNNYELVSLLNNNLLVAAVSAGLLVAANAERRRRRGLSLVVACGVLGAAAFLVKQSYILGFAVFATIVLLADTRYALRRRAGHVVLAGALMAALSASYWYPNIRDYGTPLYSPIQKLRLPLRYGLLPLNGFQRAVYLDRTVPSYGEIARSLGTHAMLRRELDIVRMIPDSVLARGALILLWAIVGLVFVDRQRLPLVGASLALAIPPFFDALWWLAEPRYFYPLFPVLIFLSALGTSEYLAREQDLHPEFRVRFRRAFAVLALLMSVATMFEARWGWREEFAQARSPKPAWIAPVNGLPRDAIIMTALPPMVSWWTSRRTVVEPLGSRRDLDAVMTAYRPGFYLDIETGNRPDRPPFAEDELQPMAAGSGWALYRISR